MRKLIAVALALLLTLGAAGAYAQLEVQQFPPSGAMYGMLDLTDPYKTVLSGLFIQDITEGGLNRQCYVYIGAGNRQMEANVTIIPDSGVDAAQFLEQSGWKDIADEQGLILMLAVPEQGGWDTEKDLTYMNNMWTQTHVRYWYNCQKHNSYMVAYGDGATLGQMWGMQAVSPQKLVSFATFGDFAVDPAFIEATAAQDTKVEGVTVGQIPMPVWFFVTAMDEGRQGVLAHWNSANDVGGEVLSSELTTAIYMAKANTLDSLINEQAFLAQTRYTVTDDAADYANVGRNRAVWRFLSSVIRPVGYANNQLRPYRSVDDWGAVKRTVEVDGVARYWLEFVPQRLSPTQDGKAPLVVFFHGNNQGAETYLANSDAIKLANDRGFIAMIMTGALYNQDTQMPNPRWNLDMADEFDDFAYVRAAIADCVSRQAVDTTRIYAMGLSYGSMATQMFALDMSDIFAAAAPASGLITNLGEAVAGALKENFPADRRMPIFLLQGEFDGNADFYSEAFQDNYRHWLTLNGLSGNYDEAGYYKTGPYNVWVFEDDQGVPLVQYAMGDNRIHTIVLEDQYLQYDTFLSKWSRAEDGTLYYLGKPVK